MRAQCDRCGRTWTRDAVGKQCRKRYAPKEHPTLAPDWWPRCSGTFVLIDESKDSV